METTAARGGGRVRRATASSTRPRSCPSARRGASKASCPISRRHRVADHPRQHVSPDAAAGGKSRRGAWRPAPLMAGAGRSWTDSGGFQFSHCATSTASVTTASFFQEPHRRLRWSIHAAAQHAAFRTISRRHHHGVRTSAPIRNKTRANTRFEASERTLRWARVCQQAHARGAISRSSDRAGRTDRELRERLARELTRLDFPGYAIGGMRGGRRVEAMVRVLALHDARGCRPISANLYGASASARYRRRRGGRVDMFDCVHGLRATDASYVLPPRPPSACRNRQVHLKTPADRGRLRLLRLPGIYLRGLPSLFFWRARCFGPCVGVRA